MNLMDVWLRKIRVRVPRWARSGDEFVSAVQTPSMPRWTYQPRGPFQLVRFDADDISVLFGYDDRETLDEILAEFVRLHLPRHGEMCVVLDLDHQAVLVWRHDDEGIKWGGCHAVFRTLERYHDPMDVWLWGQQAEATDMISTMEGMPTWTTLSD